VTNRGLVVKVTAGADAAERCNQGFTVAATAVASGVPVSLWLTGEASWYALPGRAEEFSLPHAAPLADLLAGVLAAGTVTVCTQCAARRDIKPEDVINGIRIAGSATFVAEVMADGAQALVYLADGAPTAASRSRRRSLTSCSCFGSMAGSWVPDAEPSSRSASAGLRTRAGPCR
jgi:predicted peroxiredoxin